MMYRFSIRWNGNPLGKVVETLPPDKIAMLLERGIVAEVAPVPPQDAGYESFMVIAAKQ